MLNHPAFLEWRAVALAEEWVIPKIEVDEPAIEDMQRRR